MNNTVNFSRILALFSPFGIWDTFMSKRSSLPVLFTLLNECRNRCCVLNKFDKTPHVYEGDKHLFRVHKWDMKLTHMSYFVQLIQANKAHKEKS